MSETTTRTITLSDRPPVTIVEADWPVIASAKDSEHDNQYEFQANTKSKWGISVREHDDGRAIVYATYSYTSNWQNARDYSVRHGQLLAKDAATTEAICAAIKEVASRMADAEHHGEDAARWPQLADECIADMPAETL